MVCCYQAGQAARKEIAGQSNLIAMLDGRFGPIASPALAGLRPGAGVIQVADPLDGFEQASRLLVVSRGAEGHGMFDVSSQLAVGINDDPEAMAVTPDPLQHIETVRVGHFEVED